MLSDRDVVLALAVVLGAQVPMEVYLEGRSKHFHRTASTNHSLMEMTSLSSRRLKAAAGLNEVPDGIATQRLEPRPHVTHKPALELISQGDTAIPTATLTQQVRMSPQPRAHFSR